MPNADGPGMIQLPDVAPPPYDQEAEHAVLGSTQLDREPIAHVRGLLPRREPRRIFAER
jgi:hypothetical protein